MCYQLAKKDLESSSLAPYAKLFPLNEKESHPSASQGCCPLTSPGMALPGLPTSKHVTLWHVGAGPQKGCSCSWC